VEDTVRAREAVKGADAFPGRRSWAAASRSLTGGPGVPAVIHLPVPVQLRPSHHGPINSRPLPRLHVLADGPGTPTCGDTLRLDLLLTGPAAGVEPPVSETSRPLNPCTHLSPSSSSRLLHHHTAFPLRLPSDLRTRRRAGPTDKPPSQAPSRRRRHPQVARAAVIRSPVLPSPLASPPDLLTSESPPRGARPAAAEPSAATGAARYPRVILTQSLFKW
jgi:hypothetical protein